MSPLPQALSFLALVCVVGVAEAQMYKCTDSTGRTSFQQSPCQPGTGQAITVRPASGSQQSVSGENANSESAGRLKAWANSNKRHELEGIIRDEEQNIARYQSEMDAEINQLKYASQFARNNLAGAIYDQSLSTKMQAAASKYKAKIDQSTERMRAARDALSKM